MPPLFSPFRALGYITDGSSLAVQRRGKDSFAAVSVGKAWQVCSTALSVEQESAGCSTQAL